jgi:uncharacterized membrane protein
METYSHLLGFIPAGLFISMILFSAVGVTMALLIDSQKRDQNSTNTPVKFSFLFLIRDNWKTILLAFLAVLLTLRFAGSIFPDSFSVEGLAKPIGEEKWLFGSFCIGLVYNSLLQFLKEKSEILKTR